MQIKHTTYETEMNYERKRKERTGGKRVDSSSTYDAFGTRSTNSYFAIRAATDEHNFVRRGNAGKYLSLLAILQTEVHRS